MATKKKTESAGGFSKYIRWFWILFGSGILIFFLIFQLAAWGVFGEMPDQHVMQDFLANEKTTQLKSCQSAYIIEGTAVRMYVPIMLGLDGESVKSELEFARALHVVWIDLVNSGGEDAESVKKLLNDDTVSSKVVRDANLIKEVDRIADKNGWEKGKKRM